MEATTHTQTWGECACVGLLLARRERIRRRHIREDNIIGPQSPIGGPIANAKPKHVRRSAQTDMFSQHFAEEEAVGDTSIYKH